MGTTLVDQLAPSSRDQPTAQRLPPEDVRATRLSEACRTSELLGAGDCGHPAVAIVRIELHAWDRQVSTDDVADGDPEAAAFAVGSPVDRRTTRRAKPVSHRPAGVVPDSIDLETVVGIGFATDLHRFVGSEIGGDLEDAARPPLAEVAVAGCHHPRFALD